MSEAEPPKKRARKRSRKSKSSGAPAEPETPVASNVTPQAELSASVAAPAEPTTPAPITTAVASAPAPSAAAAAAAAVAAASSSLDQVNPHKPSFLTRQTSTGRSWTLSVAIPGSIVLNAQSPELKSRLAAHIARTCAIFNVDEIVVFDEGDVKDDEAANQQAGYHGNAHGHYQGYGEEEVADEQGEGSSRKFDPHTFLARVLQYLETPQYLRKALFPMHRDLRLAGLMPPLDCPHHLRFEDVSEYREGVTVEAPRWAPRSSGASRQGGARSVWVNIGLRDPLEAELPSSTTERIELGTRVTVQMPTQDVYGAKGRVVSPRSPTEKSGLYWGYTVRLATSLASVLTSCPYNADGYDLVIGTSERGTSLTDLLSSSMSQTKVSASNGSGEVEPLPPFHHALIVFGGLSGLEMAVESDAGIQLDRHAAKDLFDAWVNVVENQGSRTVRTEEAIMIALARLKAPLELLGGRAA
ncbi:DUF171-domain-containing protein [Testicularia cyperi]|uniref:DUF171-domain-containing protein n=1 Tax=Testicularia cyperi TaxID=1882483 RepID=A0A317XIZ0_9BASI|nr:DUF171-domain-containing protein [Testicularia cyperi]